MQTRREYLVTLGLALPNTRGKFSRDGMQALDDARAKGMTFSDDTKPEPKRKAKTAEPAGTDSVSDVTTEDKPTEPKSTKANEHAPHRRNWTDAKYIMFAEPAGKTWFKTPCTECSYSVANCRCGNTQVWGDMGRVKCAMIGPTN